jgi:putative redox protein
MGRSISVEVNQIGASTSRGVARSHEVNIDRPVEKGGEDRGPLGGELLLLSLGGCFMSTLLAAAKAREVDLSDVKISVEGRVGGVPERVEAMHMRISATYTDADMMRRLILLAERGCLVTNTLRDAVAISVTLVGSDP